MPNKASEVIKGLSNPVVDWIFSWWIFITVGLLGLVGMYGKKTINRMNEIFESHVPSEKIDKKFNQVYIDMKSCQKDLSNDMSGVRESVSEVHGRIDDIYHILVSGNSHRPARKEERKNEVD